MDILKCPPNGDKHKVGYKGMRDIPKDLTFTHTCESIVVGEISTNTLCFVTMLEDCYQQILPKLKLLGDRLAIFLYVIF